MKLNFKGKMYKEIAIKSKGYSEVETDRKISDAFMLLIQGVKEEDLSYMCKKMQDKFKQGNIDLTVGECYSITQGNLKGISVGEEEINNFMKDSLENYLLNLAYECVEKDKRHLGDNVILDATINTSSWISHSLIETKAAKKLAKILGLDSEKAGVFAMLHDYGRKQIHDFSHVTRGFEALIDKGWVEEARATITHSFINAGRCATCDPAIEGFYINEEGKQAWEEGTDKDDITEVLENIKYDDYDMVLNIVDLMATDKGITSPYNRVQDVATRKKPDIKNRGYFLSEFTNKLISVIQRVTGENNCGLENTSPFENLDILNLKFKEVSEKFYALIRSKTERRDLPEETSRCTCETLNTDSEEER